MEIRCILVYCKDKKENACMYSFMSLYQCWGDLAGFPSSFFMEMRIDLHKFWPAEQAFFNGNSKPINLSLEISFWLVLTFCPMTLDDELILSCPRLWVPVP